MSSFIQINNLPVLMFPWLGHLWTAVIFVAVLLNHHFCQFENAMVIKFAAFFFIVPPIVNAAALRSQLMWHYIIWYFL